MKIILGILVTTLANFSFGVFSWRVAYWAGFPVEISSSIFSVSSFSFLTIGLIHKFLVISALTWALFKVMPLLDKPRKRILFIFFLGTIFSFYFYLGAYIFWNIDFLLSISLFLLKSKETFPDFILESINWLISGFILAQFIKPKHLGAL